MQVKNKRRLTWLAIPLTLGLLAAACGDDDDDDASAGGDGGAEAPEEDFSGESIAISGSSTVEPISAIVAEEFNLATGADVSVDGPGTGDGFELFCNGETDISDASRAIDEEEIAACEANGIEYIELLIAYDGMAVMTSPNNDAAPECLSFADLYALIGPESEGFDTWSDAAPLASELGSSTEFPDAELALTGPGPESGTYDSFIEIALSDIAEARGLPEDQIETTRPDYDQNADDNIIIQNIESSDTSLGWVGWAFASEAEDAVATIPVSAEPGGDCVEVSDETIADQSYPLSRPLYIYVNAANAESNPALAPFVDFYLADLSTWVEEALYVPLPEDQAQETTATWEAG